MSFTALLRPAALAAALATAMPLAQSAEPTAVENCLAASFYPDGTELYGVCSEAIAGEIADAKIRAKVNLQLGQALYFAHQPGMALPFLDTAIKDDPGLDQAYRRRGWSHLMSGMGHRAMADFTEYLSLAPEDPDAKFAIAFARAQLGAACAATASAYEGILKQHPDHHITRYNLASTYTCIDGNSHRQVAEYDKVIGAGRDAVKEITYFSRRGARDFDFYAMVRSDRINALWRLRRFDEVISDATWLIENYPDHSGPYTDRADAHNARRDYVKALQDTDVALRLSPGDGYALSVRVEALVGLKRYEDAIAAATVSISSGITHRSTARLYFWRGLAHRRIDKTSEAIDDFNKAMTLELHWVGAVQTQLNQNGYLFGELARSTDYEKTDFLSAEFRNALDACMVDPECMR